MGMEMGICVGMIAVGGGVLMNGNHGSIILACMSEKRVREGGELVWDRLWGDEHERNQRDWGGPCA